VSSKQRRTGRVFVLEVGVVQLRSTSCVAAFLAHVDLVSSLFVREVELATVHLATVRLQRTALCERLATLVTLIRTNSCAQTHRHTRIQRHGDTKPKCSFTSDALRCRALLQSSIGKSNTYCERFDLVCTTGNVLRTFAKRI